MPCLEHERRSRIAVVTWLITVLVTGLVKIIVGSLHIDSGCLGLSLLPYYLLFAGILSLAPAAVATASTSTSCSRQLEHMWGIMAKVFLMSVILMTSGTVYTLSNVVRVSSLDRLCTQPWVVVFGLTALATDWVQFAIFCRLFCFHPLPQPSLDPPSCDLQTDSPFHAWKLRVSRPVV